MWEEARLSLHEIQKFLFEITKYMNKLLWEKTTGSADSKDLAAPAAVSSAEEPKVSSYSGETKSSYS